MAFEYPYGDPGTYIETSPVHLGQNSGEEKTEIVRGGGEVVFGIIIGTIAGVLTQIYTHTVLHRKKMPT